MQGASRPANLAVHNNRIMPLADYDAVTAGNCTPVRNEGFNVLRQMLVNARDRHPSGHALGHLEGNLKVNCSLNTAILYDLALMGDGGLFTDRIITPMFQVRAPAHLSAHCILLSHDCIMCAQRTPRDSSAAGPQLRLSGARIVGAHCAVLAARQLPALALVSNREMT